MYRLDGITVPLALAGCLWLVGRPWLGSILLAVATWIKVWPAALLVAAVIAVRRRFTVIAGAALVSVLTLAAVFAGGGIAHAFGFVTDQTDRGLQLEAPVSAWYLWGAVLGIPGSSIYYDRDILTFQVMGPGVQVVVAVMTPLLIAAVAAVAGLGAFKAWRGASFVRLFPPLALALVLAFIVFNKVGSPQYMTWIIAPLVVGLVVDRRRWWRPAALGLVIAAITQVVYPLTYWGLLSAEALPAAVLTLRNVLVAVLLVWAIVRVAAGARPHHGRAPAPPRSIDQPAPSAPDPEVTMLIAFSVAPSGAPRDGAPDADASVHDAVAAAVRVVRESGLPHRTTSMFTEVEGEWDEVFDVVKRATEAVLPFGSRVSLVLKADIRPGLDG